MRNNALLSNIHPSGQLVVTAAVILFVTLVTITAGFLAAVPFTNNTLFELMEGINMNDPGNLNLIKYMQVISHLGLFIIPSFILAWLFWGKTTEYLFLKSVPGPQPLILSALLIFVAVPFINYILELNMQMHLPESLKGLEEWMRNSEEAAGELTEAFLSVESVNGLLFNIFMVAIIPAIGEELMFRGVLMRIFHKWTLSGHFAVWITAIIFSAIHMQFFGFFPRMFLGILFGYLVLWTGSLWPAIIAHFVNNAAAVIFFYLFHHKITDGTYENLGKGNEGLVYAIIAIIMTAALMWWIRKTSTTSMPPISKEKESADDQPGL
jgi:membrane protease YdiL (CAAX protease family)